MSHFWEAGAFNRPQGTLIKVKVIAGNIKGESAESIVNNFAAKVQYIPLKVENF